MVVKKRSSHQSSFFVTDRSSSSSSRFVMDVKNRGSVSLPLHQQQQQQQQQQAHPSSFYQQRRPQHAVPDRGSRSADNSPRSMKAMTSVLETPITTNRSSSSHSSSTGSTVQVVVQDHSYAEGGMAMPEWSANPQSPGDDTNTTGNNNNNNDYYIGNTSGSSADLEGNNNSPNNATTAFSSSSYRRSHSSAASSYLGRVSSWIPPWTSLIMGMIVSCVLVLAFQSRAGLVESLHETATLEHNGHKLQDRLMNAEKGVRMLQREVSAYEAMYFEGEDKGQHVDHNNDNQNNPLYQHYQLHGSNGKNNNDNNDPGLSAHRRALEDMKQLSSRLTATREKADKLKQQVQTLSKQEAIEKYGDHVHRVELELAFPDRRDGPTRLVMELAPLHLMPHSVHFFLEMVSAGLLDGCSFILNALHVLKAAPLPYDGSSAANKARAFTRMGLESVAFKEYAPEYPHEQYTVGFAADGSPSFYINTEDNSEIHLGDPCFGKIVEGFDTVKRLEASPTRNGIWFEQRIGIKKATVLT